MTDAENSLFTNVGETMPRAFTALRFERGTGIPPEPPIPIDLISGHLTTTATKSAARGRHGSLTNDRPLDGCPTPTLRSGQELQRARCGSPYAKQTQTGWSPVSSDDALEPGANFGVRITVHTTESRPTRRSRTASS